MRWAQFPRFTTGARFATLVVVVASAGCFETGNQCQRDFDCRGGDVCANTHECLGASEVYRVAVRWTVRGNPASATTCAGITSLEITVVDDASSTTSSYAPVPCEIGIFTFDKLPVGFNRLTLTAYGSDGLTESYPANIGDSAEVQFDLGIGTLPPDAGVP